MDLILGNQNTGTMSGTTPALYVLVKQSTGKPDQGTLLSNQDNSSLLSSAAKPVKPKAKTYLPADCASGNITVMLDNNNMWNEFYHRSTEMILTKQGRRMFPYCRYWISGLESNLKYILVMDISPIDNFRYKWNGHSWEPSGKAEPHVLGRVFIHPESPSTGHYWMHQPVSFYKLKLTNNTLDQEGHIILHSMHRYLPRLHLVPAEKATEVIQLNGPDVRTFTFPQTEFFAVTAYQNIQITQLKIDYNPFAKGFREDGLSSRLQRDMKQNGSSEHEGNSVTSSPTNHRHPLEGNILDPSQKLDLPPSGICDPDLEKESLSPYHEFLHFAESDVHAGDDQGLKEEASESPISNPCQKLSHVTSQLTQERGINVSVKEEPLDNYEYEPLICMEGVNVKEEETNNIAEEYSKSDSSILEQQLEKYSKIDKMDIEFHKEQQINQLGVAKAKMLKLDSGKMPVVYLESCTMTRDTVKVSALSQALMTTKNEKSPNSLDSFPAHFENRSISSPPEVEETEKITTDKMVSENITPHIPSEEDVLGISTETYSSLNTTEIESSRDLKAPATSSPSLAKVIFDDQNINMLKTHISGKSIVGSQNVGVSGPKKRGRPRKSKLSEGGRSSKCIAKSDTTNNDVSLGSGSTHLDVNPDLEDVDGMLFVSFVSKVNLYPKFVLLWEKELQNTLNNSLATCNPQRIQQMEKELLEDLKSFKYKQVIHPSLQEVGLKLNFVDPTMSIDLKYLGVQLPLSYSEEYASWKNEGTDSNSADTGLHFISRTGKTNDITKIKGWRGKFHNTSKNEGIILEGLLKNRSAFCSDKLDEYLENEGKLMETSIGFSPSTSSSPVVYQLPTKSTSYVRTLDSVLKKQSTASNLSSYTSKPLDLPSISKKIKEKMKNKKQAISKGKEKSPPKGTIGLSVAKKHKHKLISEEKVSKSQAIDCLSQTVTEKDASMVSGTEGNLQSKQITMRQVQQQQGSRLSTLSKTQLKLLDLEDCALWDGKPRTYITEERAELSLTILLTAQASLKNKPIHKIIKKKAPPCNNDFCRLGCICSSLAVEKRQPTHCRKPDCMFGCTCLKRKVVLVKHKKIQEKPLHGKHKLYCEGNQEQQTNIIAKDDQEKMKLKDKKKKKKIEYTICDTEPEKPVKNFPLWVKKDGEMDPEPIYIPTPSDVEATMSPVPDIIPTDDKPTAIEVNSMGNGVKPLRVYTPRPNPVIREEDKDPVYLYFESMMTCARVRIYERKVQEKGQQEKCPWNCEKHIEKEHDADPQPLKIEEDKDPGEKSWWFSCSAEHPSTSYVHRITPDGKNKLIEIISDCNWEEDRKEILSILSQHIRNKMPKSLKVGHFIIELESESKTWDEKHTPIYSSRVKISMPPCQNKNQNLPVVVESPNAGLSPCKRTEKLTPQKLQKQRKKGLPFYAGLSSAGKLIANTCKYDLNPSGSIQVNGKHSPQAKLILGQMGALHPASHLAAYLMGRLQPTMSDLSTTNVKIAPSNKLAVSESLPTEASPSEASKTPFSADTTSVSTARVSSQRQIAPRPLLDGVTNQFTFLNIVGGLQKKASETGSSQSLTRPQKSNTKSISSSASSTTVVTTTAITSVASLPVTISSPLQNNSPDIACTNTVEKQEINIPSAMDAVEMTKPVTSMPFGQSSIPVSTSTAVIPLPVTSPTSSVSCVQPTGLSGIQKSPVSNQKQALVTAKICIYIIVCKSYLSSKNWLRKMFFFLNNTGATSPPGLPRGAEYRMGTRFILIPVQQCSSNLRPSQNMQLASGKRIVLQPLRHPGAVNLYRHPNGQIIQLVPLQQLQTSGAQSTLQPIMFRNPGSVVGIRLPGPSKLPEIAACQASAIPSVTSTTTSITTAVHSALITQVTPVNSSGSVSPVGTLTLRISPSGIKNNSDQTGSQSKIRCNASEVPSNINNLISLQSGSFALLQFPGQKNDPGSIAKKVAPLEIKISHKTNELSANKLKEDSICSQMAEITGSEISKLKENNLPDFHSEEITCNRNISEIIEKDAEILNESSEFEETVDIETVEEFSEKVNLAHLKATAAHQSEFPNKKVKNEEQAFANYRQTHTANERRRRKEMRGLFEKLKATLGLQAFPKVSKCFILKQALEEIQGLTDQADKLTGQKNLLLHMQDTLVRKESALSGETQEVVLKKLEYIYAKQKAVAAAQKGKQKEQTDPTKMIESTETASPSVEKDPTSVLGEVKPVVLSKQRTKPLILSRKGNHVTGRLKKHRNNLHLMSKMLENEDSFLMPRIVNVTSLATEEEINLNPDETSNHKCKENEDGSEKERNITKERTTQDLLQDKYSFPQIVNVSSLKGSPEIFGTKLCFEELTGSQTWVKEVDGGGGDCQKSKKPSLQKLQVNKAKDPGSEMERQQVASVIHEPTMDTSSSVDIEENDDTDETLTSLLNEIAFLNQKLSDDTSDIPEISSSFSLADTESRQESNSASSSAFQFGTVDGNFKDLSMIQDNGDSITPLLLHLDDDDFPVGNRNAGEVSSEPDALKIMLGSEVKDRNSNLLKINGNGKNTESSAKTRSVSPPILHMKTNLEAGISDMSWRPMPKLAPLGLKTANHSLDSEGQSTKVMPALASVASKEKKLAQSAINPSQDSKATNTKATAVTKSN
uniref:MAX gene-associated protein n=1 Tax=Pseudonaja textilis TaxID=8673 RepID=A0A670Y4P9_PSETE